MHMCFYGFLHLKRWGDLITRYVYSILQTHVLVCMSFGTLFIYSVKVVHMFLVPTMQDCQPCVRLVYRVGQVTEGGLPQTLVQHASCRSSFHTSFQTIIQKMFASALR